MAAASILPSELGAPPSSASCFLARSAALPEAFFSGAFVAAGAGWLLFLTSITTYYYLAGAAAFLGSAFLTSFFLPKNSSSFLSACSSTLRSISCAWARTLKALVASFELSSSSSLLAYASASFCYSSISICFGSPSFPGIWLENSRIAMSSSRF